MDVVSSSPGSASPSQFRGQHGEEGHMDQRIAPLAEILRLNTRLFVNCLDGMTDDGAAVRPSASTNSAAFVAAHVAEARFFLLNMLGAARPSPISACLEGARG